MYFFSSLFARQRRKKVRKKEENTQLLSTSSLRSAVFNFSATPNLLASLVASLDARQMQTIQKLIRAFVESINIDETNCKKRAFFIFFVYFLLISLLAKKKQKKVHSKNFQSIGRVYNPTIVVDPSPRNFGLERPKISILSLGEENIFTTTILIATLLLVFDLLLPLRLHLLVVKSVVGYIDLRLLRYLRHGLLNVLIQGSRTV